MTFRIARLAPLFMAAVSVVVLFFLLEAGFRIYEAVAGGSEEYEWEAASRWRGIHRMSDHDGILYELVPGAETSIDYGSTGTVTYSISSAGVRDRGVEAPIPAEAIRILVIGDSVTFGYYVPEESTFVARARRCLADRGMAVDVVNGGVGGYNTYNQVEWLKVHGLPLDPDLVVLAFCPNDVDNPYYHFAWHTMDRLGSLPGAMIPDPAMRSREPAGQGGVWGRMRKQSKFLSFLLKRVEILRISVAAKNARHSADPDSYMPALPYGECLSELCDPGSPRVEWLDKQMDTLDSLAASAGFEWMVLALPLSYQRSSGPGRCAQKTVSDLAGRYGRSCVDPLAAPPDTHEGLFFDPTHLTPRGHRWIGDTLCEGLFRWVSEQR